MDFKSIMEIDKTTSLSDFEIIKLVGKGSYGEVFRVVRKSDGKTYAMKKINIKSMKKNQITNTLNEVRILSSISHDFIVSYKEAFIEDNFMCIVMEFVGGGDLQ